MSLPKSWAVKNDGSQKFKDTVIKYLNENHNSTYDGICFNSYYGLKNNGDWICNDSSNHYATILTLEEFINLTTPNMKTTEEQIKDIEKQLEALKASLVKPQFEKFVDGQWIFYNMPRFSEHGLSRITIKGDYVFRQSPSMDEPIVCTKLYSTEHCRPATPSEVQEALTKEAIKIGIVKGATVSRGYELLKISSNCGMIEKFKVEEGDFEYYPNEDILRVDGDTIYCQGKWATIIKDEVIKIGGYEVVFTSEEWENPATNRDEIIKSTKIDGNVFTDTFGNPLN